MSSLLLHTNAIEAALWLSLFAAPLGAFLIFRKLSFYGDALGHASMTGLAVILLLGVTHPVLLSLGALGSVLVTAGILWLLEKKADLAPDVAMTVSYSGMFALGLCLLTKANVNVEQVLFGNIWSISSTMLWFLRIWGTIVLILLSFFWKALWASLLDATFAKVLGYPTKAIDLLFLILTAVSVVGMIQSVGVILVAAYLVIPAASALPWVKSIPGLVLGASLFAVISSLSGLVASIVLGWQAGPCIGLSGFCVLLLSHSLRQLKLWGLSQKRSQST